NPNKIGAQDYELVRSHTGSDRIELRGVATQGRYTALASVAEDCRCGTIPAGHQAHGPGSDYSTFDLLQPSPSGSEWRRLVDHSGSLRNSSPPGFPGCRRLSSAQSEAAVADAL